MSLFLLWCLSYPAGLSNTDDYILIYQEFSKEKVHHKSEHKLVSNLKDLLRFTCHLHIWCSWMISVKIITLYVNDFVLISVWNVSQSFFFVLKYVINALKCIQILTDSKLSSPERVFLCFALDGTVHMAMKNLLNTGTGSKHTNIIYDQLLTLCFEFRLHPIILALLPWEQV